MKVEWISTHTTPEICIVRVGTDDGLVGIGQTAPQLSAVTSQVLHQLVGPFFLGRPAWHAEALVEEYLRRSYKFSGSFVFRALCGVETALWDLMGRASDQPVHSLLGGTVRDRVPVYASSMRRDISPEEEAERLSELVRTHGFRAVKIRLGDRMGADRDASPQRTERIIPFIRDALGADVAINADANSGFSVSRAIAVGRLLEEHGYHHFEEPVPYQQQDATAQVSAALDIAVAGGEQDNQLTSFRQMAARAVVDILQPDVGYIGGVSRARRAARIAQEFGMPCTPHCANQSMLQVFTMHLAAAMPAISQFQEFGIEAAPWSRDVYDPVPAVVDGDLIVPSLAGWGVEVTRSFMERAEHHVLTGEGTEPVSFMQLPAKDLLR